MSKVLLIEDLISPKLGPAFSIKPMLESLRARYYKSVAKTMKVKCLKEKDSYIIHALIPSEHNEEYEKPIFYDVIIEFYPYKKDLKSDMTVKRYGVKAYSNCPSFTFNFTYLYARASAIPSFIPTKYYNKQALVEPPKKNNPYKLYGIEKSLWYTINYLLENFDLRKNRLELILDNKLKPVNLLKDIMSQEEKMTQIEYENKKVRIAKQKSKDKQKKLDSKVADKAKKQDKFVSSLGYNKVMVTSTDRNNLKKNSLSGNLKK